MTIWLGITVALVAAVLLYTDNGLSEASSRRRSSFYSWVFLKVLAMSLKFVFQSDFWTLKFMMLGICTYEARVFAFL